MAKITVRIPEPKEEYDFSNQYNGVFVNLADDSWSSFSSNQILENDNLIHQYGQIYTSSGTIIEKVTATNFQDNIYDNASADNEIYLGLDDDNFYYFGGSDQVYGGQGSDYVYLDFSSSDFYAAANSGENKKTPEAQRATEQEARLKEIEEVA